jgi:hypothetical protein
MPEQVASRTKDDSQLWAAITGFERILEIMPTDAQAIEALGDAYHHLGETAKASSFFVRLANLCVAQRDVRGAETALKKLKEFDETPEVGQARRNIEDLLRRDQPATPPPAAAAPTSSKRTIDITQEVSLAWDLLQAKEITDEEYSGIVHDLTESSMKMPDVPVTVLHALHDRSYKGLDRILAHLSQSSSMPYLTLVGFEVQKDAFGLLPLEFVIRRGAMVFELMGSDALVAVLNPFDLALQEDAARITARRCHFYLTSSADYDLVLNNMRKALAAAQA